MLPSPLQLTTLKTIHSNARTMKAPGEGEEEETQCSVRAKASAPVTEPQLQCGSSRGGGGDNDDEGDEGDDGNAAPSSFGEVGSI